jgi:hypothetical protein
VHLIDQSPYLYSLGVHLIDWSPYFSTTHSSVHLCYTFPLDIHYLPTNSPHSVGTYDMVGPLRPSYTLDLVHESLMRRREIVDLFSLLENY